MSGIDEVVSRFKEQGWVPVMKESVLGRSPNPTRVDLARGRREFLRLLMYAWNITGEGKGRSGDNFRIQRTRSHDGPLLIEAGRITIGFGVDRRREVIAAFDGWTKRNTGESSSVHIKRALLDDAAVEGYAEGGQRWDARAAARFDAVDRLVPWIRAQIVPRFAAVGALHHEVAGDLASVRADLWDASPAAWLRSGDLLVITGQSGSLVDNSIWSVNALEITETTAGRNIRRSVTFTCRRYGRVNREAEVLSRLSGGLG